MSKLKQAAMDVLRWLDTSGHTIIPLSVRDEFVEEHKTALRAALAEHATVPPNEQKETVTVLPDGSAFFTASMPLPADHWIYAPRTEWDNARDEYAECPLPILGQEYLEAVKTAARYAIRGATNRGKETDFDPDALVQNMQYVLCGPTESVARPTPAPPCKLSKDDLIAELQDARKEATFYRQQCEVLQQQDLMLQRQYQEMQQILVDQLSRPRAIILTEPPRELSDEKDRALCESAKYQEEEKYFTCRAYMDTRPGRTLFNAGFERGWKAARVTESKVREG